MHLSAWFIHLHAPAPREAISVTVSDRRVTLMATVRSTTGTARTHGVVPTFNILCDHLPKVLLSIFHTQTYKASTICWSISKMKNDLFYRASGRNSECQKGKENHDDATNSSHLRLIPNHWNLIVQTTSHPDQQIFALFNVLYNTARHSQSFMPHKTNLVSVIFEYKNAILSSVVNLSNFQLKSTYVTAN